MERRSSTRKRTKTQRSSSGSGTPPSSPSWIPNFNSSNSSGRGGHLPPSTSLVVPSAIKKKKRGPYLCTRCGEPKKGHNCVLALVSSTPGQQPPSIFEPRIFVHPREAVPASILAAPEMQVDVGLDVQSLFDNAVSSFYSATSRQPSMLSSGTPFGNGAPWFDMPLSSLRSLSRVLRSNSSGWPGAQQSASEVEEMIMILEDKKQAFMEHTRVVESQASVKRSLLGERTITQLIRDVGVDATLHDTGDSVGSHGTA